jgi:hypothetical protein
MFPNGLQSSRSMTAIAVPLFQVFEMPENNGSAEKKAEERRFSRPFGIACSKMNTLRRLDRPAI